MTIEELHLLLDRTWPGLNVTAVNVQTNRIDVTTFGDSEPRYIAGPRSYDLTIRCNETAMRRLWGVLSDPDVHGRDQNIEIPIIENRGRAMELPEE